MSVTKKYEQNAHKWNLSIVITLGLSMWAITAYFVSAELNAHSVNVTSHPTMTAQLDRLEANQVGEQIEKMDQRICDDPSNGFYRSELRKLITQWEKIMGERYPTQLLRCGK